MLNLKERAQTDVARKVPSVNLPFYCTKMLWGIE
jgi:hypothetical protein